MERDTKPNVQKSPSSCYCMKLLTQPTQQRESDTRSPRAAPSMGTLVFTWGVRGWGLGVFGGVIISIGRKRNSIFCSSALGVAIGIAGGSLGALGDVHRGRRRCRSLQHLPVRAPALGRLTELRAHLHLTANFACIKSRQSFLSCVTDI